jgi:uncharacterized protein (DUF362 family)
MMERRDILKLGLAAGSAATLARIADAAFEARSRVVMIKTEDRRDGVRRALGLLGVSGLGGKSVVVKPNCNSADPFPGSTHLDTLEALGAWLGASGASQITVADRSGMGNTREVMEDKGVFAQAKRLGWRAVVLDELPAREWIHHPLPGGHWKRGVLFPKPLETAGAIVNTCCLKTHRFGGDFTLSLKNSVGAVAKTGPDGYNYMRELHSSARQRLMIAEINQTYRPALVLLDGMEAFVNGGPEWGGKATPGILIAGADRVAVDAVGVAVLRLYGTTPAVSSGPIFGQEQIARAADLGLGVGRPELIDLVTDDRAGEELLARVRPILLAA